MAWFGENFFPDSVKVNGPWTSIEIHNHVVQNRHTGEQMTHWDMLNKATIFENFFVPLSQ